MVPLSREQPFSLEIPLWLIDHFRAIYGKRTLQWYSVDYHTPHDEDTVISLGVPEREIWTSLTEDFSSLHSSK